LPRVYQKNNERLVAEQGIADHVNDLPEDDKKDLQSKVDAYFDLLKRNNVNDFGVVTSAWYSLKNTLILVLGFLPAMLGTALNFLPVWLSKYIADTRVKQLEFYASVQIAVAIGGYIIYTLLWLIGGAIVGVLGTWQYWLFLLMIPIWGYLAVLYYEFYQKWKSGKAFKKLSEDKKNEIKRNRMVIQAINVL